tara:strand:+ start:1373 stop:2185 length:813 start_codon:yes stop_codon:yes gene_type:complete
MNKLTHFNPIVSDVIEQFQTVELMARIFTKEESPSAVRGLLISGDAGMGKTYFTMKGLYDSINPNRIHYIKGSSITAAAFYVKLYFAKEQGSVLVLDDVDIIHKSPAELNTILDLLKGATEMTSGSRSISWERASTNQLMKDHDIPSRFDFQGSIVWITNDTIADIEKKAKGHFPAISSRMTQIPLRLDNNQKLQYTLYLLSEQDMLGKSCNTKEGGYTSAIQQSTIDFIRENYRLLTDITPRAAAKIADTMEQYPDHWKMIIENSMFKK